MKKSLHLLISFSFLVLGCGEDKEMEGLSSVFSRANGGIQISYSVKEETFVLPANIDESEQVSDLEKVMANPNPKYYVVQATLMEDGTVQAEKILTGTGDDDLNNNHIKWRNAPGNHMAKRQTRSLSSTTLYNGSNEVVGTNHAMPGSSDRKAQVYSLIKDAVEHDRSLSEDQFKLLLYSMKFSDLYELDYAGKDFARWVVHYGDGTSLTMIVDANIRNIVYREYRNEDNEITQSFSSLYEMNSAGQHIITGKIHDVHYTSPETDLQMIMRTQFTFTQI